MLATATMRRDMRCVIASCLGAALCSIEWSSAIAFPRQPSALRWSAPDECPGATDVRARLDAIVGHELASTCDADVTVTRQATGRYAAELRIHGPTGEAGFRALEEGTCDVMADAVATVVAMSLGAHPHAAEALPEKRSLVTTPPAPKPTANDASALRAPSTPRFAAGLIVSVDHGTLPATAFGGGVALAWYPITAIRVEGAVARWFQQSTTLPGESLGGSFQLTSVDLRSCWSMLGSAVTVGPCAGLEIAHVDASGNGSTSVQNAAETWWAPSLGASVRWAPLERVAFELLADVVFPTARRPFVITNVGPIHRPAWASPRAQFVGEVRF